MMDLPTLIAKYNSPTGNSQHVINRKTALKAKTYVEVLDCIKTNGVLPFDGKTPSVNHHFRNNFWYSCFQPDRNAVVRYQLKDELYKLLLANPINKRTGVNTFEDVFTEVKTDLKTLEKKGIKGINGQLTIYDVSLYIGSFMDITPKNKVYIHRGAKVGAHKLGLTKTKSVDRILDFSDVITMCPELITLGDADHIENFLCIAFNHDKIKQ